jgi:toxin-antitoxin system PIN domain toxin
VILVDANILLYASDQTSALHMRAQSWLDGELTGLGRVGLPWTTLLAFLRIATNPRVFPRPLTMADAWQQVTAWLARDPVWVPQPTERHADVLGALLAQPGVLGNLVTDAHLAALAIEHGLTLCSTDGDFARFPGLRWLNPLAPSP